LDSLWSLVESTLLTTFKREPPEILNLELKVDLSHDNHFASMEAYLLNVREIVAILMNLLWNQLQYVVNGVTYDKFEFCYEAYYAKTQSTGLSLTELLF
jgi:hypothetical protein